MGNSFYETRLLGIMVVLGLGVISRKTEGKDPVPTTMKLARELDFMHRSLFFPTKSLTLHLIFENDLFPLLITSAPLLVTPLLLSHVTDCLTVKINKEMEKLLDTGTREILSSKTIRKSLSPKKV